MDVMPGYKLTEVGVIPEDWEVKAIDDVGYATSGKRLPLGSSLIDYETSHPYIRVTDMRPGTVSLSDIKFVPDHVYPAIKRYRIFRDDIFISVAGTLGIVGKVPDELDGANLTENADRITNISCSRDYLLHVLMSPLIQNTIDQLQTVGAQPKLALTRIRKFIIPLPPTAAEQRAIAEVLSDADALIASVEQLIAKKRRLRLGTLQELLRPKDGWIEKKLGDTAVLKARIGWQGLTTAEYLETGEYYLVTGTDFKNGYIDWRNCHFVDEFRYKQDRNIQLRHNDVVVTKDGTIGKVALINDLDKPATLNSGVFVIRPIEGAFHPRFFYYLMCSSVFSEFLAQLSAGSTINHLYQKDFVTFVYKTPATVLEQEEVALILADMDAEIAALESKLVKYRQLKQGMMHNLLTGKVRLVAPTLAKAKRHPAAREENTATVMGSRSHSWAFKEAVIISVLADQFGKPEFPLGRKRRTKLSYLFHRKTDQEVQGYLKKAAGPYNPRAKYAGPEKIAQENGYVRNHQSGKFNGFIAADNIAQAKAYFAKWYEPKNTAWLEQFRFKSNDELECLATVDMAMQELLKQNKSTDVESVRALIASEPEWIPKLERSAFSDAGITEAIAKCYALFG